MILVRNGEPRVLAEAPGGFLPGHWYRLGLRAGDSTVEATIDGVQVFHLEDFRSLGRGQIGLYTQGPSGARFDDVGARTWRFFRDEFSSVSGRGGSPSPPPAVSNQQALWMRDTL